MFVFRVICAVMVAWAMNWALSRPEAAVLLTEVPEMKVFGPIAGAIMGFFILARRQGWGLFVGTLNGLWTGILSIALSGFLYLSVEMWNAVSHNLVKNFDAFLRILATEAEPLFESGADYRLVLITVGATAVIGLVSEFLHWSLARLRRLREDDGSEST